MCRKSPDSDGSGRKFKISQYLAKALSLPAQNIFVPDLQYSIIAYRPVHHAIEMPGSKLDFGKKTSLDINLVQVGRK